VKLLGPFAPDGLPEKAIVKAAFGGRFGAQLRVKPTDTLMEGQPNRKFPGGPQNASGVRQIQSVMAKAIPATADVKALWLCSGQALGAMASSPKAGLIRPGFGMLTPVITRPAVPPRPLLPGTPLAATPMVAPTWGTPVAPSTGAIARGFTPGRDPEDRPYDLETVIVNFCNVGASYGVKVLKRSKERRERLFDWDGVRKCVRHVTEELGLKAVGCCFEHYRGPDCGLQGPQVTLPDDIRAMCSSVQETPPMTGKNMKSADDEMTIKCAYRRNCRFLDNDNYRDWLREMRDEKIKVWLQTCQEMMQMRYFFDTDIGSFDLLDGNVPEGLLDPTLRRA